jgi:hypothetical protein
VSRVDLQTAARLGTVTLVNGYRTASGVVLGQVYRARPMQIKAPSVFVDSVGEDSTSFTIEESQRVIRIGLRVVWGVYDAGSTVDQRDRFVDGFYGHVMDNYHAFGANTECVWVGTSDDEDWSPDWIATDDSSYFSTLVTLEGRAST